MIIKAIYDSIHAQEIIPYPNNPFTREKFDYLMDTIFSNKKENRVESLGILTFTGTDASTRTVEFELDHDGFVSLMFSVNGKEIDLGEHLSLDYDNLYPITGYDERKQWDHFLNLVMDNMERAVVYALLDGDLTEEEFYTCRVRYDYATNQNDVLGRLSIIREISSVLFDAVAKGESNVKMDECVDEIIHSVNELKKVVQIKK
jgi:hypothetical protein